MISAMPSRMRRAIGTGQVQARLVISAAPQQAPTIGPVASSLRAARRAGLARVNAATMTCGSPNSATAALAAASAPRPCAEVVLAGLVQPVGQFLDDGCGQLGGQRRQVAADQAGFGHGLASRAALIMAAKSRQSARLPDSARVPAAVSRYSRRWRPATTDHDPAIRPACLQPPQRRVDRAGRQVQPPAGAVAQRLDHRVAMRGPSSRAASSSASRCPSAPRPA